MPIGIQRLNAKRSQPNANIVFIKPLPGPNEKTAQGFLERIAAQCLPVMRKHHISVMALEEYEPNREFVGRNFNAGEVIQLVLRSPQTGRWLPFEYVQMVMMHELAHCKQMNHSRAFWAVRNQYAAQMNDLWREGYTGEGIWGRGASLATGEWERNQVRSDEVLPEHLCGGTYRSRRGKRKVKPTPTYQERKERMILKKFGRNGVTLGGDVEARAKLEKGKKIKATPRVANSIRGRELRAAAAMARMEQEKEERQRLEEQEFVVKDEDEEETESGSESEYEDGEGGVESKDAVDVDGTKMLDKKGRGMVKVCEDEDTSDPDAQNELSQLAGMFRGIKRDESPATGSQTLRMKREPGIDRIREPSSITANQEPIDDAPPQLDNIPAARPQTKPPTRPIIKQEVNTSPSSPQQILSQTNNTSTCSICSFTNPPTGGTCTMCANVLNPTHTPDTWRCPSSTCKNTHYVNSGDCGVCGLCGQRRN